MPDMASSRSIVWWITGVVMAAGGVAMVAALYVYIASERIIHQVYDVPLVDIDVPTDSASIAEGERLAHISGCFGCHGPELEGEVFRDDAEEGYIAAPNLARVAREYSTAELARVIRYGVRANGEGVQIMPSLMFYNFSDADLGRLMAFLKSLPDRDGLDYAFRPAWAARWLMVTGEWYPIPGDLGDLGARMPAPAAGDTLARGAYIAQTACTECHGGELDGGWGPDLAVIGGYTPEAFAHFLETGVAPGGREVRVMSGVARGRFSYFTDDEVAALDAFLRARVAGAGGGLGGTVSR